MKVLLKEEGMKNKTLFISVLIGTLVYSLKTEANPGLAGEAAIARDLTDQVREDSRAFTASERASSESEEEASPEQAPIPPAPSLDSLATLVPSIQKSQASKDRATSDLGVINSGSYQFEPDKDSSLYVADSPTSGSPIAELQFFPISTRGLNAKNKRYIEAGELVIKNFCCGDSRADKCYPKPSCINNSRYKPIIEDALGCGIWDSKACDNYQKRMKSFKKSVKAKGKQLGQKVKDTEKSIQEETSKIKEFADSKDIFSDASLAGRIALLEVDDSTSLEDIQKTEEGKKVLEKLKGSVFDQYLKEQLDAVFDPLSLLDTFEGVAERCQAYLDGGEGSNFCGEFESINNDKPVSDYDKIMIERVLRPSDQSSGAGI